MSIDPRMSIILTPASWKHGYEDTHARKKTASNPSSQTGTGWLISQMLFTGVQIHGGVMSSHLGNLCQKPVHRPCRLLGLLCSSSSSIEYFWAGG